MSTSGDVPQTPPGFPPGSVPTQSPYAGPTGPAARSFDSAKLDPGLFDVSSEAGPLQNDGWPLPAIIAAARDLARRYWLALWLTDAIKAALLRIAFVLAYMILL